MRIKKKMMMTKKTLNQKMSQLLKTRLMLSQMKRRKMNQRLQMMKTPKNQNLKSKVTKLSQKKKPKKESQKKRLFKLRKIPKNQNLILVLLLLPFKLKVKMLKKNKKVLTTSISYLTDSSNLSELLLRMESHLIQYFLDISVSLSLFLLVENRSKLFHIFLLRVLHVLKTYLNTSIKSLSQKY
jgi:hypothetical protein